MSGLGIGLGIAGAPVGPSPSARNIVAWGDSLTAGSGSSDGQGYPRLAEQLFTTPRRVLNRGVGAQTSAQIAARQGGLPILLTLEGDIIPEAGGGTIEHRSDFSDGTLQGWEPYSSGALSVVNSRLRIEISQPFHGAMITIGAVVAGATLRIEFDVTRFDFAETVDVGLLAGAWLEGVPQSQVSGKGHVLIEVPVTNSNANVSFGLVYTGAGGSAGSVDLDNVVITEGVQPAEPVTVTARSVSPVTAQGPVMDGHLRLGGCIEGVQGFLQRDDTSDEAANDSAPMVFKRLSPGPERDVQANTPFIPADLERYKDHVAWIWAGRNGFRDPESVLASISAMTSALGHARFLVGSVLASADDTPEDVQAITLLNAQLRAEFADRFVDLRQILSEHSDGSAGDLSDLSVGHTPRSLRSDHLHLNDHGYQYIATAMQQSTLARGW